MYKIPIDDLRLVGTSEHTVIPIFKDEILDVKDLPQRFISFSSCFRREAGAAGKDTRGILRVHQFDKLEMLSFSHPDKSWEEHEFLLSLEEKIMQSLNIPYRVVLICGGDLGFPASKKYDIEAWMPGQNRYRETHSCSNCTDFQARRLNIRYRDEDGDLDYVHTLNGTALAIGRALIAIIENNQNKDGSIRVPEVLIPYTNFEVIKR
jgi:seryl-tRNA synthetase